MAKDQINFDSNDGKEIQIQTFQIKYTLKPRTHENQQIKLGIGDGI